MGFWGFYRLDEDIADPEYGQDVIKRSVGLETDPKIKTIAGRVIPALPEEG